MYLTSMSFYDGKELPAKTHLDQGNRSPDLAFHELPAGAKSLALVCEDFDSPSGCWDMWVAWDLPPTSPGLREGLPPHDVIEGICHQGRNSYGHTGWGGPRPPAGTGIHHYCFRLFALDLALGPHTGMGKDELLDAIDGHVLDEAEITGTAQAPDQALSPAGASALR
ncbi:MAG TPA: YbhB/YbcL family Raf kinase inhibitor-like protein [Spirochaetales bacterium]|nr:YbhB/YbcL family Raf kinase inhibitor-like protein [Spirochaetales bacterium]HRY56078.1 YbhB/YbcL family Raf kinase inhibitor-like protein [Spirochaetia bacterium]HRZ66100.1 YbhB/YbcL family Raf kinase inhibitor-like protein [Spirochaetia bacterium]